MDPIALALLAANGLDQSIYANKKAKTMGSNLVDPALRGYLHAYNSRGHEAPVLAPLDAPSPATQSLLNLINGAASSSSVPPPPPPQQAQTTRFGRISRPPIVPPFEAQLQKVMGDLQRQAEEDNSQEQRYSRSVRRTDRENDVRRYAPQPQTQQRQHMQSAGGMPQKIQAQGSTSQSRGIVATNKPAPAPRSQVTNAPLRAASESETASAPGVYEEEEEENPDLPQWPLPVRGLGSRKVLSREEMLERRRARNSLTAAESRKKKQVYYSSLEGILKEKEEEVKRTKEECEKWRQKFIDLEKNHAVLTALWKAAGFSIPGELSSFNGGNVSTPPVASTSTPAFSPQFSAPSRMGPPTTVPLASYQETLSPQTFTPPILSPNPFSNASMSNPLPPGSSTLAVAQSVPTFQSVPTHETFPASSPADTPSYNVTDIDLSAFDDFFNWDTLGANDNENDADEQQDPDFVPASSPKRDSDSEEEEEANDDDQSTPRAGRTTKPKRRLRKGKNKKRGRSHRDDDEFTDPEMDEEDLFMPITDVAVPPGQMQLLEQATQDVMATFGVDTQTQLTGVVQKIVDAGEGLTGEQLEKMRSVLRWMQTSGHLPSNLGAVS